MLLELLFDRLAGTDLGREGGDGCLDEAREREEEEEEEEGARDGDSLGVAVCAFRLN